MIGGGEIPPVNSYALDVILGMMSTAYIRDPCGGSENNPPHKRPTGGGLEASKMDIYIYMDARQRKLRLFYLSETQPSLV